MDTNEERVIIRLDNGTIVTVREEEVVLKYKVGNSHKTKKFGYDDMVLMNNIICKIMGDIIDERNKLRHATKPIIIKADKVEMTSIKSIKATGACKEMDYPCEACSAVCLDRKELFAS